MILASRASRLLGQTIDAVVGFIPLITLVFIASFASDDFEVVVGVFGLSALLFCLAYVFFADALPGGQSIGKRMLGMAVVDEHTGHPCSARQSFVRNLLLAILGFLDWIFIFGHQRQRLGDMAAGTLVVKVGTAGAPQGVYYP